MGEEVKGKVFFSIFWSEGEILKWNMTECTGEIYELSTLMIFEMNKLD